MAVATHETLIPKVALKALIELTGQPQVDVALLMTLRDAVEHRLEKIVSALKDYEQRYGITFQQFEIQARTGGMPDRFPYEREKDYFEWDSLVTRKRKAGGDPATAGLDLTAQNEFCYIRRNSFRAQRRTSSATPLNWKANSIQCPKA